MDNLKNNHTLLGKKILPLVKMKYYDVSNDLNATGLCYMNSEERRNAVKRLSKQYEAKYRDIFKNQSWVVWGIFADGTFDLWSDMGYQEKGVKRNSFRLI